MEQHGIVTERDGSGGVGGTGKSSDAFIDRSKVRILLCDNDSKSSEEIFTLLRNCLYEVTSVRSARQVIDALNAEGPNIDLILSEVDLPMAKGLKMLKYIMRDKELRRIPVIKMSAQDDVSVVVKCLRLGAADYLVKPLRTNELLNLWTHVWRRRRMLGLAEKNVVNCDFDLVVSDPSDANTNSTTLFSDDTDEKAQKSANPDAWLSTHHEDEVTATQRQIMNQSNAATAAAPVEPPIFSLDCRSDVHGSSGRQTGLFASFPKKSELRIGESSAFFSYVKSGMPKSNVQGVGPNIENATQNMSIENKLNTCVGQLSNDVEGCENGDAQEDCLQRDDLQSCSSIHDSVSVERSSTPPVSLDRPRQTNSNVEEFSQVHRHPTNEAHRDLSGFHAHTAYPYYVPGAMNQVMMSPAQMYQKDMQDLPNHPTSAMFPQYGHISQCPHLPGVSPFTYYPVNLCVQPGQMSMSHPWPSYGISPPMEGNFDKVDRREAVLMKFRQKRKERCFDKKIRYVNRKRLAERRPRVRGQFVRKMNGVNVDLNGEPSSVDFNEDEEVEEDEEEACS